MNKAKLFGGLAGIVLGVALALAPVHAQENKGYSLNFRKDGKGNSAIIYDYKILEGGNLYSKVEFARISMDFNSEGIPAVIRGGWATEGYNADVMKITRPDGTVIYLEDIGVDSANMNAMPDGKIDRFEVYPSSESTSDFINAKEKMSIRGIPESKAPKIYTSPEESLRIYREDMNHWQEVFDAYKSAVPGLSGNNS